VAGADIAWSSRTGDAASGFSLGGSLVAGGGNTRHVTAAVRPQRPTNDKGKELYKLLATFNVYRTRGLAARPGSCCRISSRSQDLRKSGVRGWVSRDAEPLAVRSGWPTTMGVS
jgi:hypothetical protein